jgi:autotransporter-associated beta strand protein
VINLSGYDGFAAKGGPLTVTLSSNAQLLWGGGNFLGTGDTALVFGSTSSDNVVTFTNPINLNTGDGFLRNVYVDSGGPAVMSGVLSPGTGPSGLVKFGPGKLYLSAQNTFSGTLAVNDGILVANGNAVPVVDPLHPEFNAGAFGNGTSAINVGDGGGAGSKTTPAGANLGVLISGGDYTVSRPIAIVATAAAVNSITIGGETDNLSSFVGAITFAQNFHIVQAATTGGNALNITGAISATGVGNRQITLDNAGAVNISGNIGNGTATVSIIKFNDGTATLSAFNFYTGGTTVVDGVLVAGVDGAFGSGNVDIHSGGQINILTGVTTAFGANAILSIAGGGTMGIADTGFLNLGDNDAVLGLILAGIIQEPGTYGATGSGATNINDEFFAGTGILTVTQAVPEPGVVALLILGLGLVVFRQRKRTS